MKTYKIPVIWQVAGIVEVKAESLDEAIAEAEDSVLPDGEYIDDSFEVDYEGIPFHNSKLSESDIEHLEL